MTCAKRWLLLVLALLAAGGRLRAATPADTNAFNAALRDLSLKSYERAEADFGRFTQTYTDSPLLAEAYLRQAQARIKLTNCDGAIALLTARQAQAGKLADAYLFWQGEAQFEKGDYSAAADLFDRVTREYPGSERCPEAMVKEATARARLADWRRVVELLRQPDGVFQKALKAKSAGDVTAPGSLLLSEGLLTQGDFEGARAALAPLANLSLNPEMDWQRQSLLCRVEVAEGRLGEALAGATNLLAVAAKAGQRSLQAESIALQAGLLENLGRPDEAISAYTNNLAEGVPAERQREALWHIAELSLKQHRLPEAVQWLEQFIRAQPDAPGADVALLTLGELQIRRQAEGPGTNNTATSPANATNGLDQARDSLIGLTTRFPRSPLYGKAQLDLGWCYWLETNLVKSEAAFREAVERLPVSVDLVTAHFKLGDAQFEQTNYAGALTNYQAIMVLADAGSVFPPGDRDILETNLLERALYQAVRSALAAGDISAATTAATNLIKWFPDGFHTGRAVLLTGNEMSRRGDPAGAREIFGNLEKQATNAALLPEVQLAVARTYESEGRPDQAIGQYDEWLASHPDDPDRPRALYFRALAEFQAGRETNALVEFTNLVAQFPTNEFAPRAQLWVGAYYYNAGNPQEAEKNYELLSRNTNASPQLAYEAQMMAGRAAVAQQHWDDATNYFIKLSSDRNCSFDLRTQAAYAYADILMILDAPATNKLANLKMAIELFGSICESSNRLAALAWGEKALCYLQWTNDAPRYDQAMAAFTNVIGAPDADATARAIARVGMGVVLERRAEHAVPAEQAGLLKQARDDYLDVLNETDLPEGQRPDSRYLFWMKKAGLDAGRLSERLQDWTQASAIYGQLELILPSLRDTLEEKKARADKNAESVRN